MLSEPEIVQKAEELLHALQGFGSDLTRLLDTAVQIARERRYFERRPAYPEEWRPVLRPDYLQYVVSNWGFVRHMNKVEPLRPDFAHSYARASLKAPDRESGGNPTMIHELVYESFWLKATLESKGYKGRKRTHVVHHKNEDKWDPAFDNLVLITTGENTAKSHAERRVRRS